MAVGSRTWYKDHGHNCRFWGLGFVAHGSELGVFGFLVQRISVQGSNLGLTVSELMILLSGLRIHCSYSEVRVQISRFRI